MNKSRPYKVIQTLFEIAQYVVPVSRAKIVSALVYKNKILSYGINQMKTHPMAAKYSHHPEARYLHAEVDCIVNALNKVDMDVIAKSTMYVVRAKQENGLFVWGLAKPCNGCAKAIVDFGIKTVIYTTNTNNHFCVGEY